MQKMILDKIQEQIKDLPHKFGEQDVKVSVQITIKNGKPINFIV